MAGAPAHDLSPDARRALALLQSAGDTGVTLAQLRGGDVFMPAQATYELELCGWPVMREGDSFRLRAEGERRSEPPAPKPRVRRL